MMSEVWKSMLALLAIPDFVTALGWLFGAAMIVGGVLDEGSKQLRSWILAGVVYIIFQELARLAYFRTLGVLYTPTGALVLLTGMTYLFGLCFGWGVVFFAKRYSKKYYQQIERKFEERKTRPQDDVTHGGNK